MVDFIASLKKGIDSAAIADSNNEEIKAVFSELNRQLSKDYAEALSIEIKIDSSSFNFKEFRYEDNAISWIIASNPQKRKDAKLAEWNQGRSGYPCSIKFGGTKYVCENKRALENNLANLLADPIVAKKIMKLIEQ